LVLQFAENNRGESLWVFYLTWSYEMLLSLCVHGHCCWPYHRL